MLPAYPTPQPPEMWTVATLLANRHMLPQSWILVLHIDSRWVLLGLGLILLALATII
jgi:hypothetical protein